jgi:hypothetical protein
MVTKKQLQQVASEFNGVMALDPAIASNGKRTVAQLEADIKEAAGELRDDDEFSSEVESVLVELGIREKEEEPEEPTAKSESKSKQPKSKRATDKGKGKNEEKKIPATTFICHLICDDPDISTEQIKKKLAKNGYEVAESTIPTTRADSMKVISYLMEMGRLKTK